MLLGTYDTFALIFCSLALALPRLSNRHFQNPVFQSNLLSQKTAAAAHLF